MVMVAIVLGTSLPMLPTQILWINMTTAVALGLMLAFEPEEARIMTRPPRDLLVAGWGLLELRHQRTPRA